MSMLSKPAVGVLSQGAGSMKDVHLSKEEPSPASTYGASNTTGSVPITPADAVYRGMFFAKFRKRNLAPLEIAR